MCLLWSVCDHTDGEEYVKSSVMVSMYVGVYTEQYFLHVMNEDCHIRISVVCFHNMHCSRDHIVTLLTCCRHQPLLVSDVICTLSDEVIIASLISLQPFKYRCMQFQSVQM